MGSPPQVRGKPVGALLVALGIRITPAGAGKTVLHYIQWEVKQDHPRRCGENFYETVERTLDEGSPPQVRGKQGSSKNFSEMCRITPAGAGKTSCNSSIITGKLGSPPQVRGKLRGHLATVKQNGITPAGAGKTGYAHPDITKPVDHPRRCGENYQGFAKQNYTMGSPPQVRGKLEFENRLPFESGITPAGAGKTRLKPSNSPQRWDHPRRCGENLKPY